LGPSTEDTLVHGVVRRAAALWADDVALTDQERSVTYGEFWDSCRSWAGRLRSAGINTGDRALVAADSSIDTASAILGATAAGATAVVVDAMTGTRRLTRIMSDAQITIAICEDSAEPRLRECGWDGAILTFGEFSQVPPAIYRDSWASPSTPPLLMYTSGSTGGPRGVVCRHESIVFAMNAIQARLGYQKTDTVVSCLPMSFDYGLYQIFLGALVGARTVLLSPSRSGELPALLIDEQATVVPVVPGLAQRLVLLAHARGLVAPTVRLLTNTGEALEPALAAALRETFPRANLVLMYGLTECKRVTIADPDEDLVRPGSAGQALPETTIRIVDPMGDPLPAYEIGELEVAGPHVMDGYWGDPDLTRQRFSDTANSRVLKTGDFGYLDADGNFYHRGRRDGLFKVRGIRVSAYEIEEACAALDGVVAAVVFPPAATRPATLAVGGSIATSDLVRGLAQQIGAERIPPACHVFPTLPVASTGKVDRQEVERMCLAQPVRDRPIGRQGRLRMSGAGDGPQ